MCFELAVTKGSPTPEDRETPAAVLHRDPPGPRPHRDRGAEPVRGESRGGCHADRPARTAVGATCGPKMAIIGPFLAGSRTVLGPAESHRAAVARQRVWSARDRRRRRRTIWVRSARVETAELPWSIVELGLSSVEPQRRPQIVRRRRSQRPSAGSQRGRPGARDPAARAGPRRLARHPAAVREEVDRSCAPWGLTGGGQAGHPGDRHRESASMPGAAGPSPSVPSLRPGRADPGPAAQGSVRAACPALSRRRRARCILASSRWSTTSPRTHART